MISERDIWFDRLVAWFAGLFSVVVLFMPVLFMPALVAALYEFQLFSGGADHLTETTVGIGALLRATMRRLFRTGVRNVMQTSVGTFTRATARAITRRLIRVVTKTYVFILKSQVQTWAIPRGDQAGLPLEPPQNPQKTWVALGLGFFGIFFSCLGILLLITPEQRQLLIQESLGSTLVSPFWALVLLALAASLPLIFYAQLVGIGCRWFGVEAHFQTGVDGLLLQAYFTGGTSFLPLTTDSEYRGTPGRCAAVAGIALGGLVLYHLVFWGLGIVAEKPYFQFFGLMMLLYAFVFCFPIRPLDGQYLWAYNKFLWLAFFLPILGLFVLQIPEWFNVLL